MMKYHFTEKISLNIVHFMPRPSNQKLHGSILIIYANCSYMFHSANKEKKILANTELTHATAVYVIPCKHKPWHMANTFAP